MQDIKDLFLLESGVITTTIAEVVITITISFMLGLIISFIYKKTYKGKYYSQNFAQTLIIIGVVISIIIVAIGSNIARAFSLAGALSIIRFRSAIGNPRDIAFIFFAMGAGLATGAGLFLPAITFVIILSGLIFLLHILNYGESKKKNKILKIIIPEDLNYEGLFDEILKKNLTSYKLLSINTTNLGTLFELVYIIQSKRDVVDKSLIDDIRAINGNLKVTVLLDEQSFE
ncbi:MAG: DUF4956 domain-containing protein [Eubacteriales bacterium]